jgi:hypothetical protein
MNGEMERGSGGRVGEGVVDEVADDLAQARLVAAHDGRLGGVDRHRSLRLDEADVDDGVADEDGQIDIIVCERSASRVW